MLENPRIIKEPLSDISVENHDVSAHVIGYNDVKISGGGSIRSSTTDPSTEPKIHFKDFIPKHPGATSQYLEAMDATRKPKKKKVLLMGKSGSGKSSMRNIIFSNYVAKDVRRLGATIDVEHSSHKFLGNLQLNLWDCGGQDAFTETYLTTQRPHIFTAVGLLIYVFDVESRSFDPPSPDLTTYTATLAALAAHSPTAHVFCLIHKMDLVQADFREKVIADRTAAILGRSQGFEGRVRCFGTSIWDQSLYGAWGGIVHALMPDLDVVEAYLRELMEQTCAEEVVLFERATFLTVLSVVGEVGKKNPYADRQERLSNVIKTFKHSLSKFTDSPSTSNPFSEFVIKAPRFNLIIARFTSNTYILIVLPPGECELECARFNIMVARAAFTTQEGGGGASPDRRVYPL